METNDDREWLTGMVRVIVSANLEKTCFKLIEAQIIHYADSVSAFHVGKPHIFQTTKTDWEKP
jgi:hypothetical protein